MVLKKIKTHTIKMKSYEEIVKGCGKKIDRNGDCAYISSQSNLRLCNKCKKELEEWNKVNKHVHL